MTKPDKGKKEIERNLGHLRAELKRPRHQQLLHVHRIVVDDVSYVRAWYSCTHESASELKEVLEGMGFTCHINQHIRDQGRDEYDLCIRESDLLQ